MLSKIVVGLTCLLFCLGFAGCATKFFIAPGFTGENLTKEGIAILPVLVGETGKGVPGVEGYCRAAGEKMASTLRGKQPTLKVIGPTEVSSIISKDNLVSDYSKLAEDYARVGMLNSAIVKKMSESVGVKYFLIGRITSLYAVGSKAKAAVSIQIYSADSAELLFEIVKEDEASSWLISSSAPYDKAVEGAAQYAMDNVIAVLWKK